MSDGDGEHGDANEPPGPLPQDHSDLRRIRTAERRRRNKVIRLCCTTSPLMVGHVGVDEFRCLSYTIWVQKGRDYIAMAERNSFSTLFVVL